MSGPSPDCIGSIPRARWSTNAAPSNPNTAPDAPTVTALGSSSSAPNEPASTEAKYSATKRAWPSDGSSIVPIQYRMYMLKPMCRIPECRNAPVTSRQ